MKKTTAEKLAQHHADWTKGVSRPETMTTDFIDAIRNACDESVAKDFYWLPQIYRENATENAQVKVKALLLTKHGVEAIKSLPAIVSTICYREACSEARKSCVLKRDPKMGVVVIDRQTGRVIRVPKTVSLDWSNDDEGSQGHPTVEELEGNLPSPVEVMEKKDMRILLRKVNMELQQMRRQEEANAFRLVCFHGLSALAVAQIVYHCMITDADAPVIKKKAQDKINCIVHRTRKRLLAKFHDDVVDVLQAR